MLFATWEVYSVRGLLGPGEREELAEPRNLCTATCEEVETPWNHPLSIANSADRLQRSYMKRYAESQQIARTIQWCSQPLYFLQKLLDSSWDCVGTKMEMGVTTNNVCKGTPTIKHKSYGSKLWIYIQVLYIIQASDEEEEASSVQTFEALMHLELATN